MVNVDVLMKGVECSYSKLIRSDCILDWSLLDCKWFMPVSEYLDLERINFTPIRTLSLTFETL